MECKSDGRWRELRSDRMAGEDEVCYGDVHIYRYNLATCRCVIQYNNTQLGLFGAQLYIYILKLKYSLYALLASVQFNGFDHTFVYVVVNVVKVK